jgi:hypothetical protein
MKLVSCARALVVVAIVGVAGPVSAGNLILNGGFESPYLGFGKWTYPGNPGPPESSQNVIYLDATLDHWTYDGSALVNGQTGTDWSGPAPPSGVEGRQYVALQSSSTLSQDFFSPGGDFTLSWLAGGRYASSDGTLGGDQTYAIKLDGTTVGEFSTFSSEALTGQSLVLGGLSKGEHTLMFQGLTTTDQTAFLDQVSIPSVPEPGTWTVMVLGLGAIGAMLRHRRSAAIVR